MLLIDCYNLLHAPMPPVLAGLDTGQLCHLLARSPFRRHRIAVVCDGTPNPALAEPATEAPVELLYAGPGGTADDLIIAMIGRHSAPKRLTLISDDRQIRKVARRRRARIWNCQQAVSMLVRVATRSNRPRPAKPDPGSLTSREVQDWIQAFGLADDPDAPDQQRATDPLGPFDP